VWREEDEYKEIDYAPQYHGGNHIDYAHHGFDNNPGYHNFNLGRETPFGGFNGFDDSQHFGGVRPFDDMNFFHGREQHNHHHHDEKPFDFDNGGFDDGGFNEGDIGFSPEFDFTGEFDDGEGDDEAVDLMSDYNYVEDENDKRPALKQKSKLEFSDIMIMTSKAPVIYVSQEASKEMPDTFEQLIQGSDSPNYII
jgi:hypothetical protein